MQAVIISMHLGMLKAGILWHLLWDPGLFAAHFHDTASAALGRSPVLPVHWRMITDFACALAVDYPSADGPCNRGLRTWRFKIPYANDKHHAHDSILTAVDFFLQLFYETFS